MHVRDEAPGESLKVRRVVEAAFGQADEADLVDALRASGDVVLSLVAEDEDEIVGHLLFSKLQAPSHCLALAPLAVLPRHQTQGIGTALVEEGLARAKRDAWQAVFVLGDPDYYGRFGFALSSTEKFETTYPKSHFMALDLVPRALSKRDGAVIYAPPFLAL